MATRGLRRVSQINGQMITRIPSKIIGLRQIPRTFQLKQVKQGCKTSALRSTGIEKLICSMFRAANETMYPKHKIKLGSFLNVQLSARFFVKGNKIGIGGSPFRLRSTCWEMTEKVCPFCSASSQLMVT